jgi:hypothetical protein
VVQHAPSIFYFLLKLTKMQFIQDQFADNEENRMRACNRAVADLHEQAVSSLMGEGEYDALRLWKEALQLINNTASPAADAPWLGSDLLTEKEISGDVSEDSASAQENLRFGGHFMLVSAPTRESRCVKPLPTTIFRFSGLDLEDSSFPAKAMNQNLATITVYHIAVVLHRIAILRDLEHLLNQSLQFYELAYMALARCEPWMSAVDAQALSRNILENILTVFSSSETAPSA